MSEPAFLSSPTNVCFLNNTVRFANEVCNCKEIVGGELNWGIFHDPFLTLYYSLLGLLGVLVVAMNLSVIVGIARDVKIHQLHNFLVAGQAVSDLAVGILVVTFNLGTIFNNGEFVGASLGCSIYGFGIVITCHSTVFSLSLIAYSRKTRILENRQLSIRKAAFLYATCVWGLSFLLLGYYVLVTDARMACSGAFCNPIWNPPVIIVCAFFLGVPIAFTVKTYTEIHRRIEDSMRAVRDNIQPLNPHELHQHNKTTRLMVLMSATILVMWTPLYLYFIFTSVQMATGIKFSGFWALEKLLGISAVASSLCSPLIYAFKNKSLKLAMMYAFLPLERKRVAAARAKQRAARKMQHRASSETGVGGKKERSDDMPTPLGCCLSLLQYAWFSESSRVISEHSSLPATNSSSYPNAVPMSTSNQVVQAIQPAQLQTSTNCSFGDFSTSESSNDESFACPNHQYDPESDLSSLNTSSVLINE